MAQRPVYVVSDGTEYVGKFEIDFKWYAGFAVSQKQKCIESLHESFLENNKNKKLLEISSKSINSLGVSLSAFKFNSFR